MGQVINPWPQTLQEQPVNLKLPAEYGSVGM